MYDEVADSFDDDADAKVVLSHFATRLMMLGEHSKDAAMLREGRQLLSEFGIVETAAEKHEHEHSGELSGDVSVNISHHRVTEDDVDND
ncbi:hypothetical protein DJ84_18470 [Halorubrum ezzemoulense]|nr:hypothetical protein DJ84_18470 [Halorubrum ezzemoulense]